MTDYSKIRASGSAISPLLEVAIYNSDHEKIVDWTPIPASSADIHMRVGDPITATAELHIQELDNLTAILEHVTVVGNSKKEGEE